MPDTQAHSPAPDATVLKPAAVVVNVVPHDGRFAVQLVSQIGQQWGELRLDPHQVASQLVPSLREACAVAIEQNKLLESRPMPTQHKQ